MSPLTDRQSSGQPALFRPSTKAHSISLLGKLMQDSMVSAEGLEKQPTRKVVSHQCRPELQMHSFSNLHSRKEQSSISLSSAQENQAVLYSASGIMPSAW